MWTSLVAASGDYCVVAVLGLLIAVVSLVAEQQALGHAGFSSCDTWAQSLQLVSCSTWAESWWHMDLVALRVMACRIFLDQDQTHGSCIGRWILYH